MKKIKIDQVRIRLEKILRDADSAGDSAAIKAQVYGLQGHIQGSESDRERVRVYWCGLSNFVDELIDMRSNGE